MPGTVRHGQSVVLTGDGLTVESLQQIARGAAAVTLSGEPAVRARVDASVATVGEMVEKGRIVYGVTTGFGGMSNVLLTAEEAEELQTNVLHFHRAGVGEPLPDEDVRAAMVIRVNGALRGASGVRWLVIERLVRFLNDGVTPVVRRHGSIGASGDLTPLASIASAVVGLDGASRVRWNGCEMSSPAALERLGMHPLRLGAKEGLALVNGTSMSAGMAINRIAALRSLLGAALGFHALAVQALAASDEPFDEFLHAHKPHPGQTAVAALMRNLLAGSRLTQRHDPGHAQRDGRLVQDRYAVRCLPQFVGPAVEAVRRASQELEIEINAASDNPLIDAGDERAVHGGNFLGEHVALAMDALRAHLGLTIKHVDVQIASLMAPEFSNGLPPSLVGNPTRLVNMGLKAGQITANALMPLVLFHGGPITHLFPTHAEQFNQNVNSLSMQAADLARTQAELARQHLAVALLCATQAVDLRTHLAAGHYDGREMLSPETVPLYEAIHDAVGRPADTSRPLVRNDDEQVLEDDFANVVAALAGDGSLARAVDRIATAC